MTKNSLYPLHAFAFRLFSENKKMKFLCDHSTTLKRNMHLPYIRGEGGVHLYNIDNKSSRHFYKQGGPLTKQRVFFVRVSKMN